MAKFHPVLGVTLAGHPPYHVNVVKLNEKLYGQADYPHLSVYLTYLGSPPPCKQALSGKNVCIRNNNNDDDDDGGGGGDATAVDDDERDIRNLTKS